jgi:hypothetical protein
MSRPSTFSYSVQVTGYDEKFEESSFPLGRAGLGSPAACGRHAVTGVSGTAVAQGKETGGPEVGSGKDSASLPTTERIIGSGSGL